MRELGLVPARVEVEHREMVDVRPPLVEPPQVVRAKGRENAAVHPPVAPARQESDFRIEVRRDLRVSETETSHFGLVLRAQSVGVRVVRRQPGVGRRVGLREEPGDGPALADAPAPVECRGPVVILPLRIPAPRLPVDDHHADVRPVGHVLPDAGDGEVLLRRSDRLVQRVGDLRRLHVEEADVGVVAHLSRKAPTADDGYLAAIGAQADATAEEDIDGPRLPYREEAGVLQKEGALLRIEQGEPVQIDLLVVHLDLCEVGVVRRVERQARRDAVLQIGAPLAVARSGAARRTRRVAEKVRRDLEIALRRHAESLQLAGEGEAVEVELARHRRPEGLFVTHPDIALEVHPPGLDFSRGIAQRAERNGDLRAPADVGHAGRNLPNAVPVDVEAAAGATLLPAVARTPGAAATEPATSLPLVRHLAVVFDAGRIGSENEPIQSVVVRIQDDLEAVGFGEVGVASAVGDDDRRRIFREADDAEVERVLGVDDAHLRPFGGGLPFKRPALHKAGREGRIRVRPVAQHVAIDDGGRGNQARAGEGKPVGGQLARLRRGELAGALRLLGGGLDRQRANCQQPDERPSRTVDSCCHRLKRPENQF